MNLLRYYKALEKPSKFQLLQKDMAVNLVDGKLYFKDLNQQVQEFDINSVEKVGNGINYALKYPDGTLICIGQITLTNLACVYAQGVLYRSTSVDVPLTTYPVKFVGELPHVSLSQLSGERSDVVAMNVWSSTLSNFRMLVYVTASATVSLTVSYKATGRWK